MKLKVLASSSTGNGYLLSNGKETLIIEAGVRLTTVKKALDFNITGIAGCLVSHSHGDHAKYIKDYAMAGIQILSGIETFKAIDELVASTLCKPILPGRGYKLGNFKVIPFDVSHDVPCLGYHISHPETGNILFITDSYMCEYTFKNLSHVILEANYADDILESNIENGSVHPSMRPRLLKTHMELETCKGVLRANDLSNVINIVLVHLSSGNSDEGRFVQEVREATGKMVYCAKKGLEVQFNKQPY